MTGKPAYEELEQRINQLEKERDKMKRTEEALQESEERYRTAIENSNDGVAIMKGDNHLYVNRKFVKIFGYDRPEEVVEKSVSMFVHPDDRERVANFNRFRQQGKPSPSSYECKGIRKDGDTIYLSISANKTVLRGEPVSLVFLRDISDQKQAEEALLESKKTLEAILTACPVGVGLVCNRNLDWANAAMYRILGYEEDSLVGEGAKMLYLDDEECNRAGRALYPGMDETDIGQTETCWITKEGGVIDCHLQASPLDPNDPGKGHIVAAMDITDRKRAEKRIHTLTQQLMKAQENERQRISLYLHDDVAQNLSILKIGLETIFDDQPIPPRELTQRVSKFSQILQRAISAVRDLAYDQRPPGLDQLGLVQTVFQYCESFSEQHGLRVDFHSAGMNDLKLDFDTEINLYRLIQEALTNVNKHADASRATVRLVATHPNIILRIEDDGKGFDVEGRLLRALDEKRMGLQGMEERVNLLNGKLRIQSRLGEGTKIFVEVPYKEKRVGSEKKHPNH